MVLVKILKRRDAASVLVAILLAMIISSPLSQMTMSLSARISGVHNGPYSANYGGDWKTQYLLPLVWAVVQIVALEVLSWVYIIVYRVVRRSK